MLLLVLALTVPAFGVRPGFQSTGTLEWRDCGVGDSWVSIHQLNASPSPIKLPGDFMVSLDGTITHNLADELTLDVLLEKAMLGRYTKWPCVHDVGTCHYTDPCHFLNRYLNRAYCPPQLTANGIPCTCPFNPDRLHMPPTRFTASSISDNWKFMASGDYHVKITLNDKHTKQLRGCVEAYLIIEV
ncbi:ganglioside GM2 activator-like [Haliotis cracherodii]|uniref:ganglioside GM2 activator-like n=1 Tax=Haliotis cracherodii TaxID=6455 RepID=UPI0039E86EDB